MKVIRDESETLWQIQYQKYLAIWNHLTAFACNFTYCIVPLLSGLLGLFAILAVSVGLSWRMRKCQQEQLDRKDERMLKIVEVLNHLKVNLLASRGS